MGTTAYPADAGESNSIKLIQRGVAASSGSITISSVNMSKTICQSFPTSAGGTVAGTGSVPTATLTGTGGDTSPFGYATSTVARPSGTNNASVNTATKNAAYYSGGYFATFKFPAGSRIGGGGRYGNTPIYSPVAFNQSIRLNGTYYVDGYPNAVNISANANINYSTAVNAASTKTVTKPSQTVTGGTTNIIAKEYGIYLSNATTIVATGPCRYEVIEYY